MRLLQRRLLAKEQGFFLQFSSLSADNFNMRQKKIIATKKASRQPEDKNVIITPLGEQGVIIQSP